MASVTALDRFFSNQIPELRKLTQHFIAAENSVFTRSARFLRRRELLVEQSHDEAVLSPTFDEDSLSLTTLLDKAALL